MAKCIVKRNSAGEIESVIIPKDIADAHKNNIEVKDNVEQVVLSLNDKFKEKGLVENISLLDNEEFEKELSKRSNNKIFKEFSKKKRELYQSQILKANPSIDPTTLKQSLDFLEGDFKRGETKEQQRRHDKTVKAAIHWLSKGTLVLPNHIDLVIEAVELSENNIGVDLLSYDSPNDVISKYAKGITYGPKVDVDKLPGLSNRRELGDGENKVVIYDIANTEEAQNSLAKIVSHHFGFDNNLRHSMAPWCLSRTTRNGELTESAKNYYKYTYNSVDKKIAFKDGKPIAFMAHDKNYSGDLWWDLNDHDSNNLPLGNYNKETNNAKTYAYLSTEGKVEEKRLAEPDEIIDEDVLERIYSDYYNTIPGNKLSELIEFLYNKYISNEDLNSSYIFDDFQKNLNESLYENIKELVSEEYNKILNSHIVYDLDLINKNITLKNLIEIGDENVYNSVRSLFLEFRGDNKSKSEIEQKVNEFLDEKGDDKSYDLLKKYKSTFITDLFDYQNIRKYNSEISDSSEHFVSEVEKMNNEKTLGLENDLLKKNSMIIKNYNNYNFIENAVENVDDYFYSGFEDQERESLEFDYLSNLGDNIYSELDKYLVIKDAIEYSFENVSEDIDQVKKDYIEYEDENTNLMYNKSSRINGFYDPSTKEVFLNKQSPDILGTQIHEFSHPFLQWLKYEHGEIFDAGINLLIKNSNEAKEYIEHVKKNYPELKRDSAQFYEEVLAHIIGDNGSRLLNSNKKDSIKNWLEKFWEFVKNTLGITSYSANDISKMSLQEFSDAIIAEMFDGELVNKVKIERELTNIEDQISKLSDKIESSLVSKNLITRAKERSLHKDYPKIQSLRLKQQELKKQLDSLDKMGFVAVHNTTEAGLFRILYSGGELVAPSMAVVKSNSNYTKFGGISFIGDRKMINPSIQNRYLFYGDAYTPRVLKGSVQFRTKSEEKRFNKEVDDTLKKYGITGYYSNVSNMLDYQANNDAFSIYHIIKQFEKYGETITKDKVLEVYEHRNDIFYDAPFTSDNKTDFQFLKDMLLDYDTVITKENGYTNNGNISLKKLTPNVLLKDVQKSKVRLGEYLGEEVYPAYGPIKASLIGEAQTTSDLLNNRYKLNKNEEFDFDNKFDKLFDKVSDKYKANVSGNIVDLRNYFFRDLLQYGKNNFSKRGTNLTKLSKNEMNLVDDFIDEIRMGNVDYFESKIIDRVPLGNFGAVVLPKNTSSAIKNKLKNDYGLKLYEYENPADREKAFNNAVTDNNLSFQKAFTEYNVVENEDMPSKLYEDLTSIPFVTKEQGIEMYKHIYNDPLLRGWENTKDIC